MKKPLLTLMIVLAVLAGGCGRGSADRSSGELTLFTWAEMFPPEILEGFQKETGVTINYIYFDLNETMLTRLETTGGYDLIIADDYILETVIGKGLAAKIDKSLLSNYGNINPIYQKQFYDPADEYTVPYGSGVQTIVYDPSQIGLNITGYADLFDPSLKGKLGAIENYRVINGMALKVLGKSYNTENLDDIRAAGGKLLEFAPNIRLLRDDGLENDLISGEVGGAIMYTSQVTSAMLEKPGLKVVFPREGIGFGIMAFFIPASAKNNGAAHQFINYVLDPQRGAECFEHLGYYSTYSASDPLIGDEYKPFLTLPEGFNIEMEMIQNVSAEVDEEHQRIWTAFKEAAGR
ncbi:MAG: spermidine/putrescine ABC transporter substrate-binding protein [Treponema sp.]|jgi:spermidine/putrescine-binding protein|nr:spermidine/putrescine ABC transporter substrate-binding protein [Treponema sp.]